MPQPTASFTRFVPFDTARPQPTPADIAAAEAAYDAFGDRFGMAHDRADYVASLARAAMQRRIEAEHKARFAAPKQGADLVAA